MKAQYYVHVDTYWANSDDFFAGPFDSRAAAQAAIDDALSASGGLAQMSYNLSPDVRYGIRIHGVVSRTAATRRGMREHNSVGTIVPTNADELAALVDENVW